MANNETTPDFIPLEQEQPEFIPFGKETPDFISLDSAELQQESIGFYESFGYEPAKIPPVISTLVSVEELGNLHAAANRLDQDDYMSPPRVGIAPTQYVAHLVEHLPEETATKIFGEGKVPQWNPDEQKQYDLEQVTNYLMKLQEVKDRGYSFGGVVGKILSEMPSFMGELALTSGLFTGGKKFTRKLVEKVVKESILKKTVGKVGLGLAETAVGTAVISVPMGSRAIETYFERRLPTGISIQDGNIQVVFPDEKPFTSFLKAYGSLYIDLFTERMGSVLDDVNLLKRVPLLSKIQQKLWKGFQAKYPNSGYKEFIEKVSTKVGLNGLLGELGEEYLASGLTAITAIDDFGAGKDANVFQRLGAAMKQDIQNTPEMLAAFAVPIGVKKGLSTLLTMAEEKPLPEFRMEEIQTPEQASQQLEQEMIQSQFEEIQRRATQQSLYEDTATGIQKGIAQQRKYAVPPAKPYPGSTKIEIEKIERVVNPDFQSQIPDTPEMEQIKSSLPKDIPVDVLYLVKYLMDEGMSSESSVYWAQKMYRQYSEAIGIPMRFVDAPTWFAGEAGQEILQSPEAQAIIDENVRKGVSQEKAEAQFKAAVEHGLIKLHKPKPPIVEEKKEFEFVEKMTDNIIDSDVAWADIKSKQTSYIGPRTVAPTPRSLLQQIKELSSQYNIPIKEAAKSVLKQVLSIPSNFSKSLLIRHQLGKHNSAILRMVCRSKENFEKLMDWIDMKGGIPDDPNLRKEFFKNAVTVGKSINKMTKKQQKNLFQGKQEPSFFGRFQPILASLGKVEVLSGVPLRSLYKMMVGNSISATMWTVDTVNSVFQKNGLNLSTTTLSYEENEKIAQYLFSGDKASYTSLSEETKKIANSLKGLLQGHGARLVKMIRWQLWKTRGTIPAGLPKGVAPKTILEEGLEKEKSGRFNDWIDTQKWGVKETYYMSEKSDAEIDFLVGMLSSISLSESGQVTPGVIPSETKTRKTKVDYKRGNVINNVYYHLLRLSSANTNLIPMFKFWEGFISTNPSTEDRNAMVKYTRLILHQPLEQKFINKLLKGVTSVWWKFKFLNLGFNLKFSLRNFMQTVDFLPSQISLKEFEKSLDSILKQRVSGKYNTERVEDYRNNKFTNILQSDTIYHNAMMQEESVHPIFKSRKKVVDRLNSIAEFIGKSSISSDSLNRNIAWNLFYETAYRLSNNYLNGSITFSELSKGLHMETMEVSIRTELLSYLDKGDYRKFSTEYSTEKVSMIHFKYENTLRSPMELDTAARSLFGLIVYPVGTARLYWNSGILPLWDGIKTKDYDKASQGLSTILIMLACSIFTRELMSLITGEKDTPLPTYTPLDPGIGMLSDWMKDIYFVINSEENILTKVTKITFLSASRLEFLIPLAKEMVNYYEAKNDKANVKFWQLVFISANYKYKRIYKKKWSKHNRTDWEKISHVIFGGFEKKEKE